MEPQTVFVFVACLIFAAVAYTIPKKIKTYELYATSLFAALFGLFVDSILAVKYKFYVLDEPGIQFPPLIGQVVLYSTASIIVLNFYPYDKPLKWKLIYILSVTLLTVAFEYISFKFGFIKYNEWKIWYSAISYPFLTYFLVFHFRLFQWVVRRSI